MSPETSREHKEEVVESVFDIVPGLKGAMEARFRGRGRDMQMFDPAWVEHCADEAVRVIKVLTGNIGVPGFMQVINQAVSFCLNDEELAGWLEE